MNRSAARPSIAASALLLALLTGACGTAPAPGEPTAAVEGSGAGAAPATSTATTPPPAPAPPQEDAMTPATSPAVRTDLDYVGDGNPRHRLDLAHPGGGTRPVVVFVHGGAWVGGDKAMIQGQGLAGAEQTRDLLLAQGYAVASVGYRLSGEAPFPAQVHDVKAAIRYLRAQAADLGIDPERVAALGESAGGHLVELLALTADDRALEGDLGAHRGTSSAVRAAVSYYGVADPRTLVEERAAQGCPPGDLGPEEAMVGTPLEAPDGARAWAVAAPVTHVRADGAPLLLVHGSRDCTVPLAQSRRLAEALRRAGATTELVVVEGADHAEAVFYAGDQTQQALLRWLRTHLGD